MSYAYIIIYTLLSSSENARGGHYTCASKINNIFYHNKDNSEIFPIDENIIEKKVTMMVLMFS